MSRGSGAKKTKQKKTYTLKTQCPLFPHHEQHILAEALAFFGDKKKKDAPTATRVCCRQRPTIGPQLNPPTAEANRESLTAR